MSGSEPVISCNVVRSPWVASHQHPDHGCDSGAAMLARRALQPLQALLEAAPTQRRAGLAPVPFRLAER